MLIELGNAVAEGGDGERLIRLFSYFTIQSNLLVVLSSALLVARPTGGGRVQAVIQLDALLCILVTGVVYHTVLAGEAAQLTPSGQVANLLLHTVSPVGAVLVWLLAGPRPRWTWSSVGWSVVYPLAWVAYTFLRGAAVGWYPYPFLDVGELGLAVALRNTAVVAVVFLVLAVLARGVERLFPATPAAD
ncbi:Pr6Pr family membrane protein [Cellulomonas denverensis]|uniref:Pr6Pr family membrane protein n=1 Tax=Cellulomonas denverensis TaxID=264297 RepID=UPI0035ECEBCC